MFGGAFAAECTTDCAWGYAIKVLVKTTTAESLYSDSTCTTSCYRKPATRRYIGYFFGTTTGVDTCGVSCGCWDPTDENSVKGRIAMWNYDTKEAVTPEADLILCNRIGKDDTRRIEMVFTTKYTKYGYDNALTFAGFGRADQLASGNKEIKVVSGFCAGTVPSCCVTCDEVCGVVQEDTCVATPATVWNLCDQVGGSFMTAAYGKWIMKWDAEIVNRISFNKTIVGETAEEASGFTPAGYQAGVAKELSFENYHFIAE